MQTGGLPFPPGARRAMSGLGPDEEAFEVALGLGELAGLSVANEAESLAYDVSIDFVSYAISPQSCLACCLL